MRRFPELVLGFLIATAIWSSVTLLHSQKSASNSEFKPAHIEQQHAISGGTRTEQGQYSKPGQRGNWYDTFLNHTPDWFVAVFTALLSFVTYRLVSTTGDLRASTDKLWEAGERQIELASKTAAAQSRDMQASIEAANEANRINRDMLVTSTRAWLSVEDVKFIYPTKFTDAGVVLRLSATIKNLGQSPAASVWIDFEPFVAEAEEPFAVARDRILVSARSHPDFLGTTIFPQETHVQTELSSTASEKFQQSITTRPDGQRKGGLLVFVTVSYLVRGDPNRRVTHHAHSFLNIPIGLELSEGQAIDLPPNAFMAGIVD